MRKILIALLLASFTSVVALGQQASPRKQIAVGAAALESYVGSYQLAPARVLTISREGERLFAQLTGQPQFEIFPESTTKFFYKIVDAEITFTLDAAGRATQLTLHQNGQQLPAPRMSSTVQKVAARAVPGEQPITLETSKGTVFGSLLLPEGMARAPIVLIIAGSGPTDRNGNSRLLAGANDSLKQLAAALAKAGVASLRYDKRGVGESAAALSSEAELRFEQYVDDAVAWLQKLRADTRFTSVTILGHSEGSLVGMLAAERTAVSGVISVSGPARRASDMLREQLRDRLSRELAAANAAILSALEQGKTVADVPPALQVLYRPSVQPYLISWFKYVPAEIVSRLSTPVLIVQGTTDTQVQPADAENLKRTRPQAILVMVDGMNHILKKVPADAARQQASYSDPSLPVASELIAAVVKFIGSLPN